MSWRYPTAWAAALRLVTAWVAGRDDPATVLAEFTGSDATTTAAAMSSGRSSGS